MSKEFLDVNSNRFIENVKYYIERYGIDLLKMYIIRTKVVFNLNYMLIVLWQRKV